MIEVADYHALGYARFPNPFGPDELSALQSAMTMALTPEFRASRDWPEGAFIFEEDGPPVPAAEQPGTSRTRVHIVSDLCDVDPVFRSLLNHPALIRIAQACLGRDEICAHFMYAVTKSPRAGRRVGWHRDFPNRFVCPPTSSCVRLMICLDGMTEEGGATRFIADSHKLDDEAARRVFEETLRFDYADTAGIAVECGPGDIVAIHPKVIHGSPVNNNPRPRRNIVLEIGVAGEVLEGEGDSITGYRMA